MNDLTWVRLALCVQHPVRTEMMNDVRTVIQKDGKKCNLQLQNKINTILV